MGEDAQPSITADSLRARDEWRRTFPGAVVMWEEAIDEGVGHSFDGIDPSAMTRAFFRTPSGWPEVLNWYQQLLAANGWDGVAVRESWWRWGRAARPGERFDLINRSYVPEDWPVTVEPDEDLGFEVLFRASSIPGVIPGESATFLA